MYLILTLFGPLFFYVGLLHTEGLQQWDYREVYHHSGDGHLTCNALVPFVLFNNGNDIYSIDTDGTNLRKIVTNAGSSVLLDFDNQEQRLYWLDRNRGFLQRIYLNGTKREKMRAIGKGMMGFAVDGMHKLIFWSNLQKGTIEKAEIAGRKSQILLRGLFHPIFIAVDPVEGLLFWSAEGSLNTIQKANLDGNNVTSVAETKGEIKTLTLDIMAKKIYWLMYKRETGQLSICSSSYSGDLATVVKYFTHSSRQSVFGLSLFSDHIYYSEWKSGSIRRVSKYSGRDIATIILKPSLLEIGNIHIVAPVKLLSSNSSASSDSCTFANNNCLKICERTTSSQQCKCMEGFTLTADENHCEDINECALWNHGCTLGCENTPGSYYCTCPKGYVLLPDNKACHDEIPCPLDQSNCSHGCIQTSGGPLCYCPEGSMIGEDGKTCTGCSSPDNGGCSQICVTSGPGKWDCDCFPGYKLQLDKKRCLASGPRPFLIFANLHDIRRMNFDGTEYESLLHSQMGRVFALDYDPVENRIYFAHTALKRIESANIDGSDCRRVISEDLDLPEGLTVDAINRKIYWIDRGKSCIEKSDLNGQNREKIIQENIHQPRGICVHPLAKKLFWTDIGIQPRIESSNLDGSERMVLIRTDLLWPSGITVDFLTDKLYWCDAKRSMIESSNLDGSERRTLSQKEVGHPFDITVFEDYIWVTDWFQPSVVRIHKRNKTNVVHLRGSLQRPSSIVVVHPMGKPAISDDISQVRNANLVCNETAKHDSFLRGLLPTKIYESEKSEDSWTREGLVAEVVVTDKSDCMEIHCDINAHCVPLEDRPQCQCLEGFTGNGQSCKDIDECMLGIASCEPHWSECINTEGGYICKCRDGFLGNGLLCIDIDECRVGTHGCGENYQCMNTEGNYTCTNALTGTELNSTESSPTASTLTGSINNSSGKKQECPMSHDGFCLNGGVCVHLPNVEDYSCNCLAGYVGERCQFDDLEWWEPRAMQRRIRNVTIAISLTVLLLVLSLGSFAIYYCRHQRFQKESPRIPETTPDAMTGPISSEQQRPCVPSCLAVLQLLGSVIVSSSTQQLEGRF
ncbi:pro-epidermal growth factor [Pelodytes ibericus]